MTTRQTDGALAAATRLEEREVRSYEAEYINGLWHWDCHIGSQKVLTPRGEWQTPILFGVLDDRSRLACHLQWYLSASLCPFATASLVKDSFMAGVTSTLAEQGDDPLAIKHLRKITLELILDPLF